MKVYDILNAGPRHRFLVRPKGGGDPILVSNCTMGCEADIMNHGLIIAEKRGFQPFMLVHDQALSFRTSPSQSAEKYADALADLPPWAAGLPLRVEAKEMPYYSK